MILCKTTVTHSIEIFGEKIASSELVKMLGSTIDNKQNFDSHINDFCKVASPTLKAPGRI